MTAPTLIIGLGGVGSKIIASVEALTTEEQRKSLSFVCFDTDVNDLRSLKSKGYRGKFVQTSSKLTVGEYLEIDKQSRDSWFPVNNILCRKAVSEGAGQVRGISRLAFTSSIREGKMKELHEAIDSLYKLSGESTEQALRVIIVSTLAGGTGSGILLPVALYLRDYLSTNYQLSASISRGFFILPEVLYKVIPTESERNNLRCNAYATLKEIDAFLMKGDGGLQEQYTDVVKFELPAVGSNGLRDVDVMPFDFCFLFDGQNMDGGTLNTYDDYLMHAANCIFAQSIGPTAAKSNSTEDNVVLSLVKEAGRNRYCGAGSAMLEYPFTEVRDYIAFNWATEKMSKEWLAADLAFKEKKKEEKEKQLSGKTVDEIKRGDEFINFTNSNEKTEPFQEMIVRSCHVYDDTGLDKDHGKWEDYVEELRAYCSNCDLHSNSTIVNAMDKIAGVINEDFETDSNNASDGTKLTIDSLGDAVDNCLREFKGMLKTVDNIYANGIRSRVDSIFNSSRDWIMMDNTPNYFLENALRPKGKDALHPNAIRYYLYNLEKVLDREFDNSEKQFAEIKTELAEKEEAVRKIIDERKKKKRISKKHLVQDKKAIRDNLVGYKKLFDVDEDGYGFLFVQKEVMENARAYVQSLMKKYEVFYDNLENNLANLKHTVEELETKYKIDSGKAVRYICANKKCLEYFKGTLISPSGLMDLPEGFSNNIYSSIRKAMIESDKAKLSGNELENTEWYKSVFYNTILDFWRKTVEEQCGSLINMDVITAIKKEAEILEVEERKVADPEYRETYLIDRANEARKLATPFISVERGIQQHINETCTYFRDLESKFRVEDKDKVLPNGIPVKEDQLSRYKLLYYKAIYGKRANQIPKFAPARESVTAPKDKGEYFRAYFERINKIDPNSSCSKVITPHIDKKWHIISQLPDLDEGNQQAVLEDIFRALYFSMMYGFIEYEKYGNDKRKYVYKKARKAFGNAESEFSPSNTTELIVMNNTPCDEFYEVIEALIINPIIVSDVLKRVDRKKKKETELKKPIENSEFYKELKDLKIASVSKDEVRSVFEFPIFYKSTSPVQEYNKSTSDQLTYSAMNFIKESVLWYVEEENKDLHLSKIIWEQYQLFEKNLKKLEESGKDEYVGIGGDTLTNAVRDVISNYYYEQGDTAKVEQIKKNKVV